MAVDEMIVIIVMIIVIFIALCTRKDYSGNQSVHLESLLNPGTQQIKVKDIVTFHGKQIKASAFLGTTSTPFKAKSINDAWVLTQLQNKTGRYDSNSTIITRDGKTELYQAWQSDINPYGTVCYCARDENGNCMSGCDISSQDNPEHDAVYDTDNDQDLISFSSLMVANSYGLGRKKSIENSSNAAMQ